MEGQALILGRASLGAGAYRGGGWGVQPPPRNSEDVGGVLDRMSKKDQRLDFIL